MNRTDSVTSVSLERPMLDPELRPALVRVPDPVRFAARADRRAKLMVVVPMEAIADFVELDRPPLWRDFDAIWQVVARAAELRIREKLTGAGNDARTGLPRILLSAVDLQAALADSGGGGRSRLQT